MTTSFRGALIGAGYFAQNHLNAWAQLEGAQISVICDRDPDRAHAAAKVFGVPNTYTDAAEMFACESFDFVDIATTAASHRPLVERAVQHAKTVICQKPIAETYADAEVMVQAAKSAGASLLVHENFRWQRPFVEMKRLIAAGRLGPLQFARFSFRHGFDNYVNQPYLAKIERFTIMDVGLHLFDLARHFMGEAETLSCTTQRLNPIVTGEDAFTALLRHGGGATSICDCSFYATLRPDPFPNTVACIEGVKGTLSLGMDGTLLLHTADGTEEVDAQPDGPAWGEAPWHTVQDSVVRFQAHAIDVMAGRAAPQPSGADNLRTLKIALAAYASAEDARTVHLATEVVQ